LTNRAFLKWIIVLNYGTLSTAHLCSTMTTILRSKRLFFFAIACCCSLLSSGLLLPLAAAAEQQQPLPPPREAGGESVDTNDGVVTLLHLTGHHPDLHPATVTQAINVLRDGRPPQQPSHLRDGKTSRHLQEQGGGPSYLFVQMVDKCTFQTTEGGNTVLKSRHYHGDTVMFSDRPFTYEDTIPTEDHFDNFNATFTNDNGGMPNAAITLIQNDRSIGVVVSVFVKAVVKRRDDPDGPTYVYKLEQSDEQASVRSLSDVMGGRDKVTYDHCSIFIDSVDPCSCCPTCPYDTPGDARSACAFCAGFFCCNQNTCPNSCNGGALCGGGCFCSYSSASCCRNNLCNYCANDPCPFSISF
jgi:hypothetical protein